MHYLPVLKDPPMYEKYSYELPDISVTKTEYERLKGQIGSRIDPDYESGAKMTPAAKRRLWAIAACAVSVIVSVGAIIAACVTTIYPIMIVAIPFIGVAIGTGIYSAVIKDYDSPKYRTQLMAQIQNLGFKTLFDKHRNVDQLIGYQLLDGIVPSYMEEEKRVLFYAHYKNLVAKLNHLENWHASNLRKINNLFESNVAPLKAWRENQETIQYQDRMIRHQGQVLLHQANRHRRVVTGKRQGVLDALEVGGAIGNVMADMGSEMTLARVNQMYGEAIAPWKKWKAHETRAVNDEYTKHLDQLEKLYGHYKTLEFSIS